jgi:hypothetical protein
MSDIIKHLRELRARATAGKWSHNIENSNYVHSEWGDYRDPVGYCYDRADTALLVAAVNHLDLLLDAAEAVEREVADHHTGDGKPCPCELCVTARALREARVK